MSVNVEVAATWRVQQVNITLPYGMTGSIYGTTEVLLQETAPPDPDAVILKRRTIPPATPQESPATYGTMPSDSVTRVIDDALLAQTVEVSGASMDFQTVLTALEACGEKWRVADAAQPEPTPPPADPIPPPA